MDSDFKIMKAMLKKANIRYDEDEHEDGTIALTIAGGYCGFVSILTFAPSRNLQSIEAFE